MKSLRLSLLSCACLLWMGPVFAQTLNTSITSGGHGFVETKQGKPGTGINIPEDRQGPSKKTTSWTNGDAVAVHYFHHPAAEVETKMTLKVANGKTVIFKLKVYDPENMSTPLAAIDEIKVNGTGADQDISLIKYTFPRSAYYRYRLECASGWNNILEISVFKHLSTSTEKTYKSDYLSSPSVHLGSWRSSETAPQGESYDWCYNEVMLAKESDIIGTFVMAMGLMNGYMGIQMNGYLPDGRTRHDIIFSIWDKGSTDENPNLPDNLRAKLVDKNKLATNERFGNEGTGMKSFMSGHFWECDQFVQLITNCRKEIASYTVMENGKEVVKQQENTLVSAWFNARDGKGWQYISTLRMPAQHKRFDSWYSFLENYNFSTGQYVRKGFYRNGYACDGSGKWYHFNRVNGSHTDGSLDANGHEMPGQRYDYSFGITDQHVGPNGERAFMMTSGGFGSPEERALTVPKNVKNTAVDTINLDALLKRVDQAVLNEKMSKIEEEYHSNSMLDKTGWKIVDFSSEETKGEGDNGRAELIIDGNDDTYWHSSWWSSGATGCPHTLAFDMLKEQDITSMEVLMGSREDRRIENLDVYTSFDNKMWKKACNYNAVPDSRNLKITFPEGTKARYIKLKIQKATNDGGHTSIHEVTVFGTNNGQNEKMLQQMKTYLDDPYYNCIGYPAVKYYDDLKLAYDALNGNGSYKDYMQAARALVMYENGSNRIKPEKNVLYTLSSKGRGNMAYSNNVFQSTDHSSVNKKHDYKDADQQFVFEEKDGRYYLYSPSAKKYMTKETNKLSDKPLDALTLSDHKEKGRMFMSFDGSHNVNFGGSNQLTIDGWSAQDNGNAFRIEPVGFLADLEPTAGALNEQNAATFSAPFAVSCESGTKVYYATAGDDNTSVNLAAVAEGKAIPANAGVMVAANDKSQIKLLKADKDAQTAELPGNILLSSATDPIVMGDDNYILLKPENQAMAFFKAEAGSVLPRYRAYLKMNGGETVSIKLNSVPSGIEDIEMDKDANAPIYDLNGIRVNRTVKGGIYVKEGKKFIAE